MLNFLSRPHADELQGGFPFGHRLYVDFRQKEYHPINRAPRTTNLIAHWPLNERKGTTARDVSTGGNDGTLTNGVLRVNGQIDRVCKFNSSQSHYITMGDVLDWDGTTARSFVFWAKRSTAANSSAECWVTKRITTGASEGFQIHYVNGDLTFVMDGGATALQARYAASLNDGLWHLIAITYDGSQTVAGVTMYVDGASVSVTNDVDTLAASISTSATLNLGTRNAGDSQFVDGMLYGVRIYDAVISARDVEDIYKWPIFRPVDDNVLFHSPLHEGTGTEATDLSRFRNHGTLTNSPTVIDAPAATNRDYALNFVHADSEYITYGTTPELDWDGTTPRAWAFWVRLTGTYSAVRNIVSRFLNSASDGWLIQADASGKIRVRILNSSEEIQITSDSEIDDGEWYHVVVNYDGSQSASGVTVYINKVAAATTTVTDTLASFINQQTATLEIGHSESSANYLDADVHDVWIIDHQLGSDEIDAIYDGTYNKVGSHYLSCGQLRYALPMTEVFSLRVKAKPQFAHSVAANQDLVIFGSTAVADPQWRIGYLQSPDDFNVRWHDGGTIRYLTGSTETATSILQAKLFDASIDLGGGQTGSAFYINRTSVDTDWAAAPDAFTSQQAFFVINAFGYDVHFVELIQNLQVTAAQVTSDWKDVLNERIYFGLNGNGLGRTRCQIQSGDLNPQRFAVERTSIGFGQRYEPSQALATLTSEDGQYASDQYAAFTPASKQYNGTAAQAYMHKRSWVWIEIHDDDSDRKRHELLYFGRLTLDRFASVSAIDEHYGLVTLTSQDIGAEISRRRLKQAYLWKDYRYCDPKAEHISLLHKVVRLGTDSRFINYAPDSSMQGTVSNNWTAGGGGTVAYSTTDALDTDIDCVQLTTDADGSHAEFVVTFNTRRGQRLEVGKTFTVWGHAVAAVSVGNVGLVLAEDDSGGENDSTTGATVAPAGGDGHYLISATHTITDADSDRLRVRFTVSGNTVACRLTGVMLSPVSEAISVYVENANEGSSGSIAAEDFTEEFFAVHGFDVDEVYSYTHPYKLIDADADLWSELSELLDSIMTETFFFDESGTVVLRSRKDASALTEPVYETITREQYHFQNVSKKLVQRNHNAVILTGPKYVTPGFGSRIVWDAGAAGLFTMSDGANINVTLNNNETFPDSTEFPNGFEAEFNLIVSGGRGGVQTRGAYARASRVYSTQPWKAHGGKLRTDIVSPPRRFRTLNDYDEYEVVEVTNASLNYRAYQSDGTRETGLTEVTFDTTTKLGYAEFELLNSTGNNLTMRACFILADVTLRLFGENGYRHDAFRDEDHIRLNGELALEIASDWLSSAAQLRDVAEYLFRTEIENGNKHLHGVRCEGLLYWIKPGMRSRLRIGASASFEDIDINTTPIRTTFEVLNNVGTTTVQFLEQERNFTFEATAAARFLSSQLFPLADKGVIRIGAEGYNGIDASAYCDNTSDQTQINTALTLATLVGAVVELTRGTFTIDGTITGQANTTLRGDPSGGTILLKSGATDVITLAANSFTIENIEFQRGSDTNSGEYLDADGVTDLTIRNVIVNNPYNIGLNIQQSRNVNISDVQVIQPLNNSAIYLSEIIGGTLINTIVDGQSVAQNSAILVLTIRNTTSFTVDHLSAYDLWAKSDNNIEVIVSSRFLPSDYEHGVIWRSISAERILISAVTAANNVLQFSSNDTVHGAEVRDVWDITSSTNPAAGVFITGTDQTLTNGLVERSTGVGLDIGGTRNSVVSFTGRQNGNLITNNNNSASSGDVCFSFGSESPINPVNLTSANTTAQVKHFDNALLITKTIAAGTAGTLYAVDGTGTTDLHDLIPGVTYEFWFWLYLISGEILSTEFTFRFSEYVSAAWVNHDATIAATYDEWQKVEDIVATDEDATGFKLTVEIDSAAALNDRCYIDTVLCWVNDRGNPHAEDGIYGVGHYRDNGTDTRI